MMLSCCDMLVKEIYKFNMVDELWCYSGLN